MKDDVISDKSESKDIKDKIEKIEEEMSGPNFWDNKIIAQGKIRELNDLKNELGGKEKYDSGNAIMTIFSGAGGDDAEDFSSMLYKMYSKFIQKKGWDESILHKNENEHGGYRNITIKISGKEVYGTLKNESGVHRLVRISPFNAKSLRHTSFSMVEVIPQFKKIGEFEIPEDDLKIEFSRSSGPGGQNVNKRETAVRVVHIPTNLSAHSESGRSQVQNKEKAIEILKGKLYKKTEEDRKKKEAGMHISKSTEIEWGNQIRSYVLHPYKMVKDHRTGVEVRDVDKVMEDGELQVFLDAERDM